MKYNQSHHRGPTDGRSRDQQVGKGGTSSSLPSPSPEGTPAYLVEVPFLTSQMLHLKASALFRKVQTLQSQKPSSAAGFACLFGLQRRGAGRGARGEGRESREGGDSNHRRW